MALTGQGRFDASTTPVFKFALRDRGARSVVIEFATDGNGASNGTVNVYVGEAISGAPPWFAVKAGTVRVYPSPEADQISLVPSSGALGVCTISLSQENLGVGIFPFDGGGSAKGAASPFVSQSVYSEAQGGSTNTLTFPIAPAAGSLLLLLGTYQFANTVSGVTGWSQVVTAFDAGSNLNASIWSRVATGAAADNPGIAYGRTFQKQQFYALALGGASATAAMPSAAGGLTSQPWGQTPAIAVAAGSLMFAIFVSGQQAYPGAGWSGGSADPGNNYFMLLESAIASAAATVAATSTSNGSGGGACAIVGIAPK